MDYKDNFKINKNQRNKKLLEIRLTMKLIILVINNNMKIYKIFKQINKKFKIIN